MLVSPFEAFAIALPATWNLCTLASSAGTICIFNDPFDAFLCSCTFTRGILVLQSMCQWWDFLDCFLFAGQLAFSFCLCCTNWHSNLSASFTSFHCTSLNDSHLSCTLELTHWIVVSWFSGWLILSSPAFPRIALLQFPVLNVIMSFFLNLIFSQKVFAVSVITKKIALVPH